MCYSLPLPPFILTENREQQRFIFYLEEKIAVDKPSRVSNTNQFQNLWQLDKTRQTKQIFMKWMSTTIPVCQEKKFAITTNQWYRVDCTNDNCRQPEGNYCTSSICNYSSFVLKCFPLPINKIKIRIKKIINLRPCFVKLRIALPFLSNLPPTHQLQRMSPQMKRHEHEEKHTLVTLQQGLIHEQIFQIPL